DEMEALARAISVQATEAFVQWAPLLSQTIGFLRNVGEMAAFAARKIGLLNAASLEDQYDDLLKERLNLTERLRHMEAGGMGAFITDLTGPGIEETRAQIAAIDK